MLVMCSAYALTIGGIVFFQAVSGTGSTKTAFKLELTALIVYVLYCTVVIGIMKADIAICWIAEYVYAGVLFVISYAYIKSGRWKNRKI
jgi:Na+-driven multidrug efflux pump